MNAQPPQIQIVQQEEEEVVAHLKDYYAVLKRRWWAILLIFVIVVSSTSVYLATKSREYTATALVRISSGNRAGGLAAALGGFLPIGTSSSMVTEIEVIKLRGIAEAVIRKLELDKKKQNLGLNWEQMVSVFRSKLKAKQRGMSDLIEIIAIGASPEEARDIANTVAVEYIQVSEVSRQKLWRNLMVQMEARLNQAKVDMEESRKRLHDHEAAEGISTAFSPLLTGAGTSIGGSPYMVPEVPQAVAQLKTGIMQMEVELAALKESFADSDPNVVRLKRQIAASKRRLQQETEEAVEKYNKQFGLTRLAAEVMFNQQLYSSLVTKQEELKAQHIMQNKSPEIIERATKPLHPSKPNRKLIAIMGAAMGLLLGFGLALFREYMDNSMHKTEDVTESISIPVLGRIPRLNKAISLLRERDANSGKKALISYEDSSRNRRLRQLYKESYRMLQLELMAAASEKLESDTASARSQSELTLLITSSIPGEGKSVVATNLAVSIAQTGKKVLLVNADSRNSIHCELLDPNPQTGLMDILTGDAEWGDVVKKASLDNLYVITAGSENGHPDLSSLLISPRLEDFVESSREQFDVTIFDSSPAISTSESAAIGSKVDGVVLVIKADDTQKGAILQAKQRIQNAGGNILGAVLNCATIEKRYYK